MKNLKNKAIKAARWTSLLKYLSTVINIGSGIYLARTIDPDVFGQIGLLTAIISFVMMASMWGYIPGFMRKPGSIADNLEYLDTLFTIDFVLSSITFIILIVVGLILPHSLGFLLIVMTASRAPMTFTEMHRLTFVKELRFDRIFIIHATGLILSTVCACVLAHQGHGLWALVSLYAIENVCIGVLSLIFVSYKIRFHFNWEMARDFYDFGKFTFVTALLESSYTSLDRIFMSSTLGTLTLGFYTRAQGIAGNVHSLLWNAVSPVFESLFGNLVNDRNRLNRVYNLGSCFFLRAYLMIFVWLGLMTPEIVTILFGDRWLPAVPVFRMLLPFFVLNSLRELNRTLLFYTGNSKIVAVIQSVEFILFVVCIFPLTIFLKIQGFILAISLSMSVGVVLLLIYARKVVDVNLRDIFLKPVAMAMVVVIFFYRLKGWLSFPDHFYMKFFMEMAAIFTCYFMLMLLFERRFVREVLDLLRVKE